MARFKAGEWDRIFAELDRLPAEGQPYGLPERRDGSLVLSSFNIRALGTPDTRTSSHDEGRTAGAWDLLRRYVERCDFIAIQEVKDDLGGLVRLKDSLAEADKYALVVSDVTGARPGQDTTQERLAFLYRWDRIERTELASDITYDRRAILETIHDKWDAFMADFKRHDALMQVYEKKVREHEAGRRRKKPDKPQFVLSNFLAFIRTPHVASFRIKGAGGQGLPFLAVNAHLYYGDQSRSAEERKMEFDALVDWLRWRTGAEDRLYHRNLILFGDMNLEFEERFTSLADADAAVKAMNQGVGAHYSVNFPFLDVPKKRQPGPVGDGKGRYASTARMTETYDQIGFFAYDQDLPHHRDNEDAGGGGKDGYDYGVFFFADLFARALHGKASYLDLEKADRQAFVRRFEHDVSDHHPIWVRLPRP